MKNSDCSSFDDFVLRLISTIALCMVVILCLLGSIILTFKGIPTPEFVFELGIGASAPLVWLLTTN